LNVFGCSFYSSNADIRAYQLNVYVVFYLLELVQLLSILLIFFLVMNRPFLEWELDSIHHSNRLLKSCHQSPYQETPRTAKWIPKIKFSISLSSLQNSWFKNTSCSKSLVQYTPSYKRSITMFMQVLMACS
jgi:hypothetical protein